MFDLIIKNATVIDGTGAEGFRADVAIRDGKIAALGTLSAQANRILDATGLVLTPGFIDSHSHGDYYILRNPDHREALEQGITFAIGGQCGDSIAPDPNVDNCHSIGEFVRAAQAAPISTSYALLVGHSTLRIQVSGRENRLLNDEELATMVQLLEQSMDAGAIGMSLGLTYTPGNYADTRELTTLAKTVGRRGGILAAHIRNESDQLIESAEEFIALCKEGGCRGVISHLKAADKANHGKVHQVFAMLEQAAMDGIEIYADAYPYLASSTTLQSRFVPRQFHPPGIKNVNSLLFDPEICQKIKAWATQKWGTDLSWVLVTRCPDAPEFIGKNMNEIAHAMGLSDRYEAVFHLLRLTKGRCNGCFTMMCEEDVAAVLAHPKVMIGCDSNMGNNATQFHPRRTATYPRVLGRYVRERNITSLPEMIRKITGLPAQVYGLTGKGRIAPGYDGDICIFDADAIRDSADYVNCSAPNQGLHYVLINGQIVVEQGRYNGIRAGKLYAR